MKFIVMILSVLFVVTALYIAAQGNYPNEWWPMIILSLLGLICAYECGKIDSE